MSNEDGEVTVSIDKDQFKERIHRQVQHLKENKDNLYGDTTGWVMVHGNHIEEPRLRLSFHLHLLGYEFPGTLMLLTPKTLYILTSKTKAEKYLDPIAKASEDWQVQVKVLIRNKADGNAANFKTLFSKFVEESREANSGNPTLGLVDSDGVTGTLMDAWKQALSERDDISTVDCTRAVELSLLHNDEMAIENITKCSNMSSRLFKKVFTAEMETAIDEEKKVTHFDIAAKVEEALDNLKKYGIKLEPEQVDLSLLPVIQSGGNYNTNIFDIEPDKSTLQDDIILVSMGGKYKGYCSAIARTYLINPPQEVSERYSELQKAHDGLIEDLVPGAKISDVVKKAKARLEKKFGSVAKIPDNFGHCIGLRPQETAVSLTVDNTMKVDEDMAFFVYTALENIPLEKPDKKANARVNQLKSYSLILGDTVRATKDTSKIFTSRVPTDLSEVSYDLEDEDEDSDEESDDNEDENEDEKPKKKRKDEASLENAGRVGGRSARLAARQEDNEGDTQERQRRAEHQAELFQKQAEEARRRLAGGDDDEEENEAEPEVTAMQCYESTLEMPKEDLARHRNQIVVDKPNKSVLIPLMGSVVPFHINTIKSVAVSEEGGKTYLRFNFYAPGQAVGKDCPANMRKAVEDFPNLMFIRTLNFMSRDGANLNQVERIISALQRSTKQAAKQKQEEADIVEQPPLIKNDKTTTTPSMQDLSMWPVMSGRRKCIGRLAAHKNGLLFVSSRQERVEIIYSNVRHAVFQPCEKDITVLLHFHLKHPIMIGKKKHYEIQFFTEVVDASQNLEGRRQSSFDPDELEEEQRERKLKATLNKAFENFAQAVEKKVEQCEDVAPFKFEKPSRDAGFYGVPNKEMVFLMPTSQALVSLVDRPPFVIMLDDVEHVHFERVIFGAKNFDMIFILKKGVAKKGEDEFIKVSAIPMEELESIQQWLDSVCDKTYTWGAATLNWRNIIQEFVRDPYFYLSEDENGDKKPVGWNFLMADTDEENEEGDEEEESDFSEELEEEDDDDDEDEDDEDFDDAVEDEESEEESAEEGSESEGEDWETLEKKAAREDKKWMKNESTKDGAIVEDQPSSKRRRSSSDKGGSNKRRRK